MKRKIFKNIAMICLSICVAIGSFFMPLKSRNTKSLLASANTSNEAIYFNGSNIWLPIERYDSRSTNSSHILIDYLLINLNFSTDPLNKKFNVNFSGTSGFYSKNEWSSGGLTYNYDTFGSVSDNGYFASNDYSLIFNRSYMVLSNNVYYYDAYTSFYMGIWSTSDPIDSSIVSVELGYTDSQLSSECNYIKYTDANGHFVTFYFIFSSASATANRLEHRIYYFDNFLNLDENQSYQQGYNQGLAANQQNIYNDGYKSGYDVGFDKGEIAGAINSNDYSFLGLIGAVVDAPVSILSSLFNFTFLGVNLWSFITSLLTIALILFVVKIFMRR